MPIWGWILLIAGLSALLVAAVAAIVHHTHRRLPANEAAQGDPGELTAPLPTHVVNAEEDMMTARELEANRKRDDSSDRAYEIVRGKAANAPAEVITNLPPAEVGEVLFYDGRFWRVDSIEPAQSRETAGRLIVSLTRDEPKLSAGSGGSVPAPAATSPGEPPGSFPRRRP
jgi:hypothetical protein